MSTVINTTAKKEATKSVYKRDIFPILEMTCAACAISVESMIKSIDGVKDAGVNFANAESSYPKKILQKRIKNI